MRFEKPARGYLYIYIFFFVLYLYRYQRFPFFKKAMTNGLLIQPVSNESQRIPRAVPSTVKPLVRPREMDGNSGGSLVCGVNTGLDSSQCSIR